MKKVLTLIFFVLLGIGIIIILVFATKENSHALAKKPTISIHVDGENAFLTNKELLDRLAFKKLFTYGDFMDKINTKKNRGLYPFNGGG
jgi:hypothetical protein